MPKGKSSMGQGQSGYTPAGVDSKKGAYQYSARKMGDVNTPNAQGWNSYGEGPKRGGAIKGGRGLRNSGGDY